MSIYILADGDMNAWKCSECREWVILNDGTPEDNKMNYCSYCGSKITGIEDYSLDELVEGME